MVAGGCIDAGVDGVAGVGQGVIVVGLERIVGYIVAEQKIKNWTPISCVLAIQRWVQKEGCPNY